MISKSPLAGLCLALLVGLAACSEPLLDSFKSRKVDVVDKQLKKVIRVKKRKERKSRPVCKQEIVRGLGLEGFPRPARLKLEVCPEVVSSCCTTKDQIVIVQSLVADIKKLKRRHRQHRRVVRGLVNELAGFELYMNRTHTRLFKHHSITNCKVLLAKLSRFKVSEVSQRLLEALDRMHEYFEVHFRGLYCSACDATLHRYFHPDLKTVIFSHESCRRAIENTLGILIYLHRNLVKYVNTVVRFTHTCDARGRFEETSIPELLVLERTADAHAVDSCWGARNHPDWLLHCNRFCKKLSPGAIHSVFEPYIEPFLRLTNYLNRRRRELEKQERTDPLVGIPDEIKYPAPAKKKATSSRLLAAVVRKSRKSAPAPARRLQKKVFEVVSQGEIEVLSRYFLDKVISVGTIGSEVEFHSMRPLFAFKGLDFFLTGRFSVVNHDIYLELLDRIKKDEKEGKFITDKNFIDSIDEMMKITGLTNSSLTSKEQAALNKTMTAVSSNMSSSTSAPAPTSAPASTGPATTPTTPTARKLSKGRRLKFAERLTGIISLALFLIIQL